MEGCPIYSTFTNIAAEKCFHDVKDLMLEDQFIVKYLLAIFVLHHPNLCVIINLCVWVFQLTIFQKQQCNLSCFVVLFNTKQK